MLLLVDTAANYGRQIVSGIGRYVREHGPWSLYWDEHSLEDPVPKWLDRWRGEGIISRTATRAMARRLQIMGVPVVELLGDQPDQPAKVHCDNAAAGRLAAEHLLDCGLKNFGFFAFGEAWWIAMCRDGFRQSLEARGHSYLAYKPSRNGNWVHPRWHDSQRPRVEAWLRGLPKPAGIFAVSVPCGNRLLDLARSMDIAVPEQLAVVAVVDDPVLCSVTTPPLSSVDVASARVGYEAAALLERMMRGEPPPRHTLWIPPSHVVGRQSTDILAIDDADVAEAVHFIREHACRGIHVPEVCAAVGLSRRVLERKFQERLGRTPKEEILRVQIGQARLLLNQTDLAIKTIVRKTGFPSFKNFSKLFQRETNVTPRAYRTMRYDIREL